MIMLVQTQNFFMVLFWQENGLSYWPFKFAGDAQRFQHVFQLVNKPTFNFKLYIIIKKLNHTRSVSDFATIVITKLILIWYYLKSWFEVGLYLSFALELICIVSFWKSLFPASYVSNFSGIFDKIWFPAGKCLNFQQIILQKFIYIYIYIYIYSLLA